MSKSMKADLTADGGTAVAKKTFSAHSDVWVTVAALLDAASVAAWLASAGASIIELFGSGSTLIDFEQIVPGGWTTAWAAAPSGTPTAGEHLIELHHVNGGASDLYVDGTLVSSGTDGAGINAVALWIGLDGGSSPVTVTIHSVKVGTTRGGSEIFSDDFASGDFSAWTSTSTIDGTLSVITDADPFVSIGVPNTPKIAVELDWTNDPTVATHTWTDITPYVVSYSRDPVRTNEFDQPGPVGATIVLRNDDARFTPDNASGPYYGGLKKYRRMRVRAQWNGVTYGRYWGYVLDWPQSWTEAGKDQTVTLRLVDALTPLNTNDLEGQSFASALSGTAITATLAAAGIAADGSGGTGGAPIIDAGISTIVSSGTLSPSSYAIQRVKDIAATENGVIFANGDGEPVFQDRHHRLTSAQSLTSQGTIGDSPGEIPYVDPTPMYGDVWTTVSVTPSGGTVVAAGNVEAQANYFNQTLVFPPAGQYLVSDAGEALAAAQYLSNRYSNPLTRVDSVTAVGAHDPTTWPALLALDTSDLVLFKRRFLVNGVVGGTISLNQIVEGYGDRVTIGQDWRVYLAMSPADTQRYWLAGDAVLSLAGVTTIGGY